MHGTRCIQSSVRTSNVANCVVPNIVSKAKNISQGENLWPSLMENDPVKSAVPVFQLTLQEKKKSVLPSPFKEFRTVVAIRLFVSYAPSERCGQSHCSTQWLSNDSAPAFSCSQVLRLH